MQLMLNGISKSFKGKKVIENLNLEVSCGEILSLLGPSGCGKTTILKIIGGFVSPDSGEVILDGEDITHMMPEKRAVSTVFQSFALFPHMNVIDNITYGLKFKGYSKKERMVKGDEYLEIIGLKDDKTAMPSTLSGGQKQRVALGRSLILNPKILLLDEALSSLDAKLRIKMRSEIVDIGKKFNTTMIFVTHDQEEALSVSDRIAVMNNGRIEQIADPRELYENSSSHFVSSFIGEENIININGQIIRVRPEDIEIILANQYVNTDIGNILEGVIIKSIFMGYYIDYEVNTYNQKYNIKVKSFNKSKSFKIGENVKLKFKPVY